MAIINRSLSRHTGQIWLIMILVFSLLISQLGFFQVDVVYAITTLDYGDAPVPYPTTNSDSGAYHEATGPSLGTNRDTEADGHPSSNADGDDTDGVPDDEDGVTIVDGDATPSTTDDTDFGSVEYTITTDVHTFTIGNLGATELVMPGDPIVQVSGSHAGDFTITSLPDYSLTANPWTTSFDVTFDPSAVGLREAVISIDNNDPDENPYTFSIQGTGYEASPPEMDLQGIQLKTVGNWA